MKSVSAKQLYQYWQALRGSRPAPERREIDPSAIKALLSDVFILEHVTGADFSFRLAGSSLCSAYCRELKGRDFRQFWTEQDLESLDTMMMAIRDDAAAAVIGYLGVNTRGQSTPFEMLLLPLRYGGDNYPRILGISVPTDAPYWLGVHPVMQHTISSMRLVWPDEQPAFLRQVVNADTLLEDSFLVDDTLDGEFNSASQRRSDGTIGGDCLATRRRQAFRLIDGGRD